MKFKDFLKKKDINISAKTYFIDALGAMALGLFASLLIGTILTTLSDLMNLPILLEIAGYAKQATGAAIGISIAYSLHAPSLVLFSAATAGIAGNALGGPVGAYVATIVGTELGKLVSKETKIDIIVTPSVVIFSSVLIAMSIGPSIFSFMDAFGHFIENATEMRPLIMGIIVSVSVGMALTLPISSAALCIAIGLSGIAAGAATAGCCAQMVGFAVMSFKENRWSGIISQGIGTSMLQMPNIIKNPVIWIPPTLTAAITGPISTCIFQLENTPIGAGMGTCGLVGPFGIISAMPQGGTKMWIGILLVCFVLPAVLSLFFAEILLKLNLIKTNDLKLPQ